MSAKAEPPTSATYLVYMTVGSREEALKIAGTVVQERLAACANVLPNVTSIYEWKGEMHAEDECVVLFKTQEKRLGWLTDRLVQLHSYECPCVVGVPLADGHGPFLDWVRSQTD